MIFSGTTLLKFFIKLMAQTIILASSSPARKEVLSRLRIPFNIIVPNTDETPLEGEIARKLVERLAIAKAQTVAKEVHEGLIIACDQVITLNEEIFGKPGDHTNAVQQLTKMSGKQVVSWTGLCLLNVVTQKLQITVERYNVYFRPLTLKMIEEYLACDKPYHCAGSIKAEGLGAALFDRMSGDDPCTLLGLPLIKLVRFLENEGVNVLTF